MMKALAPVALALGLVVAACGGGGGDDPAAGCTSDTDCPAGRRCDGGTCRPEDPGACEPACSGATPICDETSGACKTCTAGAGCGGGTPVCDPAADEGLGACVGCRDTSDCTAPSVCDPESHTCIGCTATEGCSGTTPICDGDTCVACTATAGCAAPEFCDLSVPGGACVTCTATAGCDAPKFCDLSVAGGACVICTATIGCEEGQTCDLSVAGGACVTCADDADCGSDRICDRSVAGGACVTCALGGRGCADPAPVCDTSVPGGRCVGCTRAGDCFPDEFCDAARMECVRCNDANVGCQESRPYCDASADEGKGRCVGCLDDAGCAAPQPLCHPDLQECVECASDGDCPTATPHCSSDGNACVECVVDGECGDGSVCLEDECRLAVSGQIADVRNAPDHASLALPLQGALVSYVRPESANEAAGFFLQGEQAGPAIFVALDPSTLSPAPQVGDRVSCSVTQKAVNNAGVAEVRSLAGWTVSSRGNPTATLLQDLSDASEVAFTSSPGLGAYESELIAISGEIALPGGTTFGFAQFPISTAGFPYPSMSYRLRVPVALKDALGLSVGCRFTLSAGPMWRNGNQAQPSAYFASDFASIDCP